MLVEIKQMKLTGTVFLLPHLDRAKTTTFGKVLLISFISSLNNLLKCL